MERNQDTRIFKQVKRHSWNQLLSMESHQKTEADTSSVY